MEVGKRSVYHKKRRGKMQSKDASIRVTRNHTPTQVSIQLDEYSNVACSLPQWILNAEAFKHPSVNTQKPMQIALGRSRGKVVQSQYLAYVNSRERERGMETSERAKSTRILAIEERSC